MATVELRYDPKDSAWFAANATMVLKVGEPAYHSVTGKFKLGDGVTQLQNLEFLSNESQLVTATVVNKTGVNLLASNYQVVKVSTAQGQRLAIDFAQANNDNNSADTIGLVKENIAINQTGDITILGQITEINTTGSLQGETWADGDVLYLSPTTPGAITKVKPTGLTGHIVVLGYVEYAHAIHGKIYVKVMNGWELDELHNVYIDNGTLANKDVLQYESSSQLWKNKAIKDTLQMVFFPTSLNPADATTYYFTRQISPTTTAANHAIKIGFNGIITSAIIIASGNTISGSTEDSILKFRNITTSTSSTISSTVKMNGSATNIVSQTVTGLNISFLGTDDICMELNTATWVTNPTVVTLSVYLTIEKTS